MKDKPRERQRLWDFALKKKRKSIDPQTTEKILIFLTAAIMGSIVLFLLFKALSMLLD
jgi:hypothetical protein